MKDAFLSIDQKGEALYKEKASKFYAYAIPVDSTSEVESELEELKKNHHKARHFCYAYFLGINRHLFRANDDGEPSGTAGKPILGQLEKRNLTNTLVVVVRYFGGTKLGASGLIQAYKTAASEALDTVSIVEQIVTGILRVTSSYEGVGALMSIISNAQLKIQSTDYGEQANIDLEIRKSELGATVIRLKAALLNRSEEDIKEDTEVPGVDFSIIE